MTDFYSNHYGPSIGDTGHFTTKHSIPQRTKAGFGHSRLRHKMAHIVVPNGQDLGSGDVIRLFDLKSNDRLLQLLFSMDTNWGATTTFHVGLYFKGDDDNGLVVDADLFGSAIDWSGPIARVDYFKQATTLDDWDRGKMMWQLADIGAATLTEDPHVVYTVAATTSQDISAAAAAVEFVAEAIYISND